MISCLMKKSETMSFGFKRKPEGSNTNVGMVRSKTVLDPVSELIPLEDLSIGGTSDLERLGNTGNRKQSAKLTNALKNVYHSMRNILSKSQSSFSLAAANAAGKKSPVVSDSNVCYDRLSTSEEVENGQPRDDNGNLFESRGSTTVVMPNATTLDNLPSLQQQPCNPICNASDFFDCLSQGSWDDEDITCNVCDRAFLTPWHLERHRRKKRHWGCDICDSLFTSLWLLESHKSESDHWSCYSDEDEYSSCSGGDYWDDEVGCYDGVLPVDDLPICTCNEPCCVTPTEEEKIMLLP